MWDDDGAYERFMGRWSRRLAAEVVDRLLRDGADAGRWLDVGCGTGSLTAAALDAGVREVVAVEPSPAFASAAADRFRDAPVTVVETDATSLPADADALDAAASSLVLNFTPDPAAALRATAAALRPGGRALFAVWDYDDERAYLTRFWEVVEAVTGRVHPLDERDSFTEERLARAAADAGWDPVVQHHDVTTTFVDPDDLWLPFLEGVGPSGTAATSLGEHQEQVRDALVADVFAGGRGPVDLPFRALLVGTTR